MRSRRPGAGTARCYTPADRSSAMSPLDMPRAAFFGKRARARTGALA